MSVYAWWFVALCAGLCSTLQSAVNSDITRNTGAYTAMASNLFAYVIGTLLFVWYGMSQKQFEWSRLGTLRSDLYLGGVFGFGVVLFLTLCFPRLGALTTVALMILGQSAVALIVDSQGFWGVPVVAISASRIIAVALILSGVMLLNR